MLLEELGKGGNGNVEGVGAVVLFDSGEFRLLLKTSEGLEVADGWLGLGVDVILERREGLGFGVVEETALLKQERGNELATNLL